MEKHASLLRQVLNIDTKTVDNIYLFYVPFILHTYML